ncbi:ATPase AAA [Betaproteobacteria bacterium]|nr:ATPase AAA [Betaproteobacteria bacterium]
MQTSYLPRVVDSALVERLGRIGAVLIEGVKGCGKTLTARRHAQSEVLLDLDEAARHTAEIAPLNLLRGATPRLIDEWQLVPSLWNAVRREVDARELDGQFILTGSARPKDDATRHTGAGRFSRLRMRPLSLAESGLSTRQVSLAGLLTGELPETGQAVLTLDDMIEEVCHGGWPADRKRSTGQARRNLADYAGEFVRADLKTVDGVRRDPRRVEALLKALARNTASQASTITLAKDAAHNGRPMAEETAAQYLLALELLMVYEPLPAWEPVLRGKARLRSQPKHYLVDPALGAALLGAGVDEFQHDLKTFGFFFEALAVRDLRIYAQAAHAGVWHYRDSNNLEIDAIVDAGMGRWCAFEVKLGGGNAVEDAADQLKKFAAKIDTQSAGSPAALCVLSASGYVYTRPDGVAVVPLGVLGP